MKILVIGGGGREHALAWKLAQSQRVTDVFVAPGNAGTAMEHKCRNIDIAANNVNDLLRFARQESVGLTVVGPEASLAAGITDQFTAAGMPIFGPTRSAAEIETSKAFAKSLLVRHGIPTAHYREFDALEPALTYIDAVGAPIVVKADGLAGGKGVVVAQTTAQAREAVRNIFHGALGAAGSRIVVEDCLIGEEVSYIVIASGTSYVPLASAQDHKRAFDYDQGPNTGGMGAYSPAPILTPQVEERIRIEIIEPTLRALLSEGREFTGFLYAGLMIGPEGAPSVIEFNARLGDPEAQPILMRLESDLLPLLEAAIDKRLDLSTPQWSPRSALGVVMAAGGYPGNVREGDPIEGLERHPGTDVKIFHAGTRVDDGRVVTSGGRVLCVCALGDDVRRARATAYAATGQLSWPMAHYRHDIGHRALARA